MFIGVMECAEFNYCREIQFKLISNANNYTVKPPTSGHPSSGHLHQPGNIFV